MFIEKNVRIHKIPQPIVPYPHKSKKVTADGFIRDQPTLPQKVLKRIDKWHAERKNQVQETNKESVNPDAGSQISQESPSPSRKLEFELDKSLESPRERRERGSPRSPTIKNDPLSIAKREAGGAANSYTKIRQENTNDVQDVGTLSPDNYRDGTMAHHFTDTTKDMNERSAAESFLHSNMIPNQFKLTDVAKAYDFVHRPFDDKIVQAAKEKEIFRR